MGYDLHVHRAEDWPDADGTPITAEEWSEYVEASDDLRPDGFAEAPLEDGSVLRIEDETMVAWTDGVKRPNQGDGPWFWLDEGAILAKNPPNDMVRRMYAMAEALDARVQGDDGEFYGASGEPLPDPDTPPSAKRRWFGRRR